MVEHPLYGAASLPEHSERTAAWRHTFWSAGIVAVWFFFNTSMMLVTKFTYLHGQICNQEGEDCRAYAFPFMITAIHMLFSWAISSVILRLRTDRETGHMSLPQQMQQIAPLALCFSVCVVLGNLSLVYIYPSFSQMLSSVSPFITVLVAVAMRGTRFNAWTWGSMPVICGGLLLCSAEEVNFSLLGACFAMGATLLRAVKSVMQERLLDPREVKLDAVALLYYMAPFAGCLLACASALVEGDEPLRVLYPWRGGRPTRGVPHVLALLAFSGANACFLNVSGNLVTAHMGAVMLQILGNLKACISIVVSVAVLRNPVTRMQAAGVVFSLFGVWIYNSKGGMANPGVQGKGT